MQILELQLKDNNYDPSLHRLLEEVVEKVENPGLLSKDVVPVCNPITEPQAPKDKRPWKHTNFQWDLVSEALQTGLAQQVNEPEYNDFSIREPQQPPRPQPTSSDLEGNIQELRAQVVINDVAVPRTPKWNDAIPQTPEWHRGVPMTPPSLATVNLAPVSSSSSSSSTSSSPSSSS